MIVLIPAYEPDTRLIALVEACSAAGFRDHIVVIDDGSGNGYGQIFTTVQANGCHVIQLSEQLG